METVALKVQAHPKCPLFSPAFLVGLPELIMGDSWRPLLCPTWLKSHGDLCSSSVLSTTLISPHMTVIASLEMNVQNHEH